MMGLSRASWQRTSEASVCLLRAYARWQGVSPFGNPLVNSEASVCISIQRIDCIPVLQAQSKK